MPQQTIDTIAALWPYVRVQVAAAYLWWGAVWAAVGWYYLAAGRRQWLQIRPGNTYSSLRIWLHGLGMMTLAGLLRLWQGKFRVAFRPDEMTHTLSMTLQQGIICSALCSTVLGLNFFNLDRSGYTPCMLLLNMFAVMLSTVGGVIHLFPPMRERRIVVWRCAMLVSWLGFGLAYAGGYAAYLLQ